MTQDYRLISPDEVTPHPANPRRGDIPAIVESIKTNGWYGTIVVQKSTGHVIAGNHRLLAARQVGLTEIPAMFVDVDDDRALRILAVDNRSNDRAAYDDQALLALLDGLDGDYTGTGFDLAAHDQLLSRLADDPAGSLLDEWQGMPEYASEDKRGWQTVTVHFRNEQDRAAFAAAIGQPIGDRTKYLWYPAEPREHTTDLAYVSEGQG